MSGEGILVLCQEWEYLCYVRSGNISVMSGWVRVGVMTEWGILVFCHKG